MTDTDRTKQQSDEAAANGAPLTGTALITEYVRTLPDKPGVYRMIGDKGGVLYVGKAKSLKSRVTNYTTLAGQSNRIARMICETSAMEFVVTETETESLLLEANLIKSLKPRYNVLLRDDKSFANILLATDHEVPQILKHRGARKRPGHYFGPFASATAVNSTLNTLQKAFLLRSCSDSVYHARTRPCLLYQIKRCAAPCVGKISNRGYRRLVSEAERFLNGESRSVQEGLADQMEQASAAMDFEKAASLRDRIRALTFVQESQGINSNAVGDADVFGAYTDGGETCIQVFFFRSGSNLGGHAFFPKNTKDLPSAYILSAFIAQFYDKHEPPKTILLSEAIDDIELLNDALSIRAEKRVQIAVPKRGDRRSLTQNAVNNAKEALGRHLANTKSQRSLLRGLAEKLGMSTTPKRIEVYDNSHTSGTNAVGAMIVADEEGFRKPAYRKFNIKSDKLTDGDDYGMMREVLTRRFSRLLTEADATQPDWPSVVILDGGLGQLSIAQEVFTELGLTIGTDTDNGDIMVLSIAKGRRENEHGERRADRTAAATGEQFFMPGRPPFMLPPRDPVLYYMQRLRDEAHRYAIGSHRARRAKAAVASPLDEIAGIGARRKKMLLHHFGSAKAVARANKSDLSSVDGISHSLAEKIYNHFHTDG